MRNDNRYSIRKVCAFVAYIVCIVFIITFIVGKIQEASNNTDNRGTGISLFGYWPVIVVTGSMVPEIEVNSISICKNVNIDDINVQDIVAYQYNNELITHRVIEITNNSNGEKILHTKGDANELADSIDITSDMLKGKIIKTWNNVAPIVSNYMIAPGELNSLAIAQAFIWVLVTIGLMALITHWLWGFISMLFKATTSNKAYEKELECYIEDINDLLKYRELLYRLKNCEVEEDISKYKKCFNRIARARAMREIRQNSESVKDFNKAMIQVIRWNKLGDYLDKESRRKNNKNDIQ